MSKYRNLSIFFLATLFIIIGDVIGDDTGVVSTEPSQDLSSSNFNKTKDFLPGEEVVTPTGKKLKIWSTSGPVPINKTLPNESEDQLNDTHIIIKDSMDGLKQGRTRVPSSEDRN